MDDPPKALRDEDLPASFRAADKTALTAQQYYFWLVRLNFGAILTAAAIGTVRTDSETIARALAFVQAGFAATGLVISIQLGLRRLDLTWHATRALAESIRTLAWRYACAVSPFPPSLDPDRADEELRKRIHELLSRRAQLFAKLARADDRSTEQITPAMRALRESDTAARAAAYIEGRLKPQHEWYLRKAARHALAERRWFLVVATAQVLSIIAAMYVAAFTFTPIRLAGLLAAIASAAVAWLQMTRSQELAHAYGAAAFDLGFVRERAPAAVGEESLERLVADSEGIISREMNLWAIRRNVAE